ncbi:g11588 [Coccomyxa elongata]
MYGNFGGGYNGNFQPNPYAAYGMQAPQWMAGAGGNLQQQLDPQAQLRYAAALGGYLPQNEVPLHPHQAYANAMPHSNQSLPARNNGQAREYYEDELPEDEEGVDGDDSGDEDYGPHSRKPKSTPQATRTAPASRRRAALQDSEDDEDSALAQRLQAEYNGGGVRPKRAAASMAKRRLASVVADEDEEEEEEEEEVVQNDRHGRAGGHLQVHRPAHPQAYGHAQQQGYGQVHQQAYGQAYQQAYRQPNPYQEQDYEMAQRAALGLRVRPAQADHFQFAPEVPAPMPAAKRRKGPNGRKSSYYDDDDDDDDMPRKGRRSQSKVSYTDDGGRENSDFEDSEAERRERAKLQKEIVPAFMSSHEGLDDEVERVLGHRDMEGVEPIPGDHWATREFHVKWKRWSYIHCSWDTRETLSQLGGYKRLVNYMKRSDEQQAQRKWLAPEEAELQDVERQMEEELVQQHMHVERVISQRAEPDGSLRYLVKWRGLPYGECTWETFQDIFKADGQQCIDQFQEREARLIEGVRGLEAQRRASEGQRALLQQPDFLRAGQLRDYQLEGLNWLIYSWMQNNNCILADEMGLGKTIQCVSFIGYLALWQQIAGPYLVVVPLSTVPNWIKEFRKWLPQVNALVYVGDSKSREVIRAFEFYTGKRSGRMYKFDVLITTFELVLKDAAVLSEIKWSYLVVDEAHRLKNNESALYRELATWQFKNKLLVTGTPLQNSMKELWALLHFLEPQKFPNAEDFDARHSLKKAEELTQLHTELRPHLLRRVIKDVEKSLPPKNERILRVAMSPLQKQYYKWILTRNFKELNKGTKGGAQISLLNIITELKKCCNHPFLFESAEADFRGSNDDSNAVDRLVVSAGKMVLLDKLMRRLKETGHRVLIFSQMVRMLDIISDYMRLRGFQHQRLDGSTPAAQRHQAMEHFNSPGSTDFAFLLSTRAGGLGINLATADTVIIFDSDWNPQNDLQAMSRAHRIGQTETVNIYRFLTSGSVEEDILERAKQKMVLDHLVIQRMDTSGRTVLDPRSAAAASAKMFGKDELTAILRFGAEELFKEDEGTKEAKNHQLLTEDIDSILARAEVVNETDAAHADAGGDLLNAFNVATFKNEEDDAAFWNRLIPTKERAPSEEPEQLGIRAARLKTADDGARRAQQDGLANGKAKKGKAKRGAKGASVRRGRGGGDAAVASEAGPPVAGALLRIDTWPSDSTLEPEEDWPKALNRREAGAFVRGVKQYGLESRLPEIAAEVGPTLDSAPPAAQRALWGGFVKACERVERDAMLAGEDPNAAVLDWFGTAVKAAEIPAHLQRMKTLARKIEAVGPEAHKVFRLDAVAVTLPKWGRMCDWTPHDDAMLLLGIYWHGLGHWDQLAGDLRLGLGAKLEAAATEKRGKNYAAPEDHKMLPKGSQLETRVTALLKKLQTANQQPLTFGGRGRSGRAPSARTPARGSSADGAMPPKKRGGYSQAHAGGGDATDRMRSHAEASTPSKKWEGMLGEEVMLHVKKLRLLQKRGDDIPKDKAIEKTRKYLTVVGNAISHLCSRAGAGTLPGSKLSSDELHSKLWQFVARFTENNLDGENLARIYSRVSKGHGAARDSAALDRDTATAGASRGADLADDEDYVAPDSRRRSYSEAGTDDRRQQWEDEEEDDYQQEPSPQEHYPSGRRDWDRDRQRGWD